MSSFSSFDLGHCKPESLKCDGWLNVYNMSYQRFQIPFRSTFLWERDIVLLILSLLVSMPKIFLAWPKFFISNSKLNSCFKYVNAKNKAFLIWKDCTFDQFLARVYEVLQINPNEYTIKTTLRSNCSFYCACLLPMDIFDDEIVKFVLYMGSNVVNYRELLHVSLSFKSRSCATYKNSNFFWSKCSVPHIQEEVLPQMMTLWQYYYSLRDNNDIIDDSAITLTNVKEELLALANSLE